MPTQTAAEKKRTLQQLRTALLDLHKLLLAHQQAKYEKKNGRVPSPGVLFKLVTLDPRFEWFRELSEVVVGLDQMLEQEQIESKQVNSFFKYTQKLLMPNKAGTKFSKEYFAAIQNSPAVALQHAYITKLLK